VAELKLDSTTLADGQSVDAVHTRLRGAILGGELAPGDDVSQVQLAKDLGVSRTPLREALRLLEREGFVETRPNRRIRIAGFSVADMEDLYTTRIPLEALAIRLTVPRLRDEDLAALEGQMTQMAFFAEREDYERWEVPHREFHARLVAKAGPRLVRMLADLSDHCERYRRLHTTQKPRAWTRGTEEHRAILDACIAGNADLAAKRLARHLAATVLGNIELMGPGYEPVDLKVAVRTAEATGSSKT
jgi:DNA-binding GntR family transcriptional regulator